MSIKNIAIIFVLFLNIACTDNLPIDKSIDKSTTLDTNEVFKLFSKDSVEEDVIKFASDYLIERKLLASELDELKNPITLDKIRKLFFIIPLEKHHFDTVDVGLYKFGTYSNGDADRILIKKSKGNKFQVIGDSTSLYNVVEMKRFLMQYPKFNDSLKVKLYEYCIDSYTYGLDYIE